MSDDTECGFTIEEPPSYSLKAYDVAAIVLGTAGATLEVWGAGLRGIAVELLAAGRRARYLDDQRDTDQKFTEITGRFL